VERRRFFRWSGAALAAATAGGLGYAWRSNTLTVQTYSQSLWDLAKPLRIGVLSDLHAPYYLFSPTRLIAEVNKARCDLLVILGDSIDKAGNEALVRDLFQPMVASLGKFAILGNWEYWGRVDLQALRRYYQEAGCQLLINDETLVRWGSIDLRIVGLDDLLGGRPDLGLLGKQKRPSLVLSHCPGIAEEIAARMETPTFIIAGHTHGGQVAPFGVVLWLPPGSGSFVKGWYKIGQSRLYVSPGLGNSIVPFRIGSRPTLAIVDLG